MKLFYILSKKWTARKDETLTWWCPDQKGYTTNIDRAGIYSEEDALSICRGCHGASVPVSCEDVKAFATRQVGKQNETLKWLYDKFEGQEYDYKEESRPIPKHCENCGEEQ